MVGIVKRLIPGDVDDGHVCVDKHREKLTVKLKHVFFYLSNSHIVVYSILCRLYYNLLR